MTAGVGRGSAVAVPSQMSRKVCMRYHLVSALVRVWRRSIPLPAQWRTVAVQQQVAVVVDAVLQVQGCKHEVICRQVIVKQGEADRPAQNRGLCDQTYEPPDSPRVG